MAATLPLIRSPWTGFLAIPSEPQLFAIYNGHWIGWAKTAKMARTGRTGSESLSWGRPSSAIQTNLVVDIPHGVRESLSSCNVLRTIVCPEWSC